MSNRMAARFRIESVAVDRLGNQELVQAGTNRRVRHRVDRDTRIPTSVAQAISRGEQPLVLAYFDHTQTVRRLTLG